MTHRKLVSAFAALIFAFSVSVYGDTITIVGNSLTETATMTCTFNSQTNTFTFTMVNTSSVDAVITGIGFDLPPAGNASESGLNGFTGNVTFQPAGADFAFTDAPLGRVPGFKGVVLDYGFITGRNFAGGNRKEGLAPGIAPGEEATFVVSGAAFAGFAEEQICNSVFVRFQGNGD